MSEVEGVTEGVPGVDGEPARDTDALNDVVSDTVADMLYPGVDDKVVDTECEGVSDSELLAEAVVDQLGEAAALTVAVALTVPLPVTEGENPGVNDRLWL